MRLDIILRVHVAVLRDADWAGTIDREASDPIIAGVIAQEETMRPRVQGGWIIMGLAVLGATIAGGREARAALTGITIKGGVHASQHRSDL